MIDIQQALVNATQLLAPLSDSSRLDAELLLVHVLGRSRTFLYAFPENELTKTQLTTYEQLILKRCEGCPIAYLIGTREFWSHHLHVDHHTLIPRPETELLVELTLSLLPTAPTQSILDLGTGTGAIALALAAERPHWQLLACDVCEGALEVARTNMMQLGISNLKLCQSDWFASIPAQRFNAIISNPPYIADDDHHLTEGDVRFEPKQALVSGALGLDSITHIIEMSGEFLVPGGLILLEHGFDQKQAVSSLLSQYGYQRIQSWQDLQGNDRVSGGWRPN